MHDWWLNKKLRSSLCKIASKPTTNVCDDCVSSIARQQQMAASRCRASLANDVERTSSGGARSSSIDSNVLNRIDDETDVRDSDVDAAMQHARKRQKRREKEEMKRILQGTDDDPEAEFLVSDYQDSDDDNDTVDRGDDAASPSKRRRRIAAAAALVDSDSDSSDGEGNRHGTTTDNDDEEPEVRKAGVPVIDALVAMLCRHSH